jgi:hypothetical protein
MIDSCDRSPLDATLATLARSLASSTLAYM